MEKEKLFRTDLAYDEVGSEDFVKTYEINKFKIHKLVVDKTKNEFLHKKEGVYYTIDLNKQNFHDVNTSEKIENTLACVLKEIIKDEHLENKKSLVVGLGNLNVTPDALGPYVLDNIVVTRHLFKEEVVSSNYSEVSGIAPGVMGTTGIETFDIVQSLIKKIDVDFLIVVDALCSSSIERINNTIQITNTGIKPGSGIGNKRKEISKETLGIPVIAIGIPTVVDFVTITSEIMDLVVKYLDYFYKDKKVNFLDNSIKELNNHKVNKENKEHFLGKVGLLSIDEKKELLKEVIETGGYNMVVTPKEIDIDVEDLSKIVAMAINKTLHHYS